MTIRKKDAGDFPRKLTPTQVRARCVKEILSTERDYVQHLEDIVQVRMESQRTKYHKHLLPHFGPPLIILGMTGMVVVTIQ